ncbi:MAG: PQQ-dependent sugar dehydrogenase [Phycisphaerales bacterium]|nr:PQQ-dependent sugar dehydrogenase [Phycisphaerales bacterium]
MRHHFAATLLTALAAAAVTMGQTAITTQRIIGADLSRPLYVTYAPGDPTRLFVVEQRSGTIGRVRIYNMITKTLNATPFLSISPVSTGNEQGLLGFAIHPDYANNGYVFINYTDSGGTSRVVRYTRSDANPNIVDPNSAYPILSLAQPFTNHNGGWIEFGPDGYLYLAFGDGGSANDPSNRAQNLNILLGKMLRIDIDGDDFPTDATRNYRIPPTNPFAGPITGSDEIWAYGLRNAWRCSFDRQTGDLWIADVGQNVIEEINFQPAASTGGENYGWRCMEGNNCTGLTGCTCNSPALTYPVHTYSHTGGNCSITGGYVYRGNEICDLKGTYFFADYCSNQIWSFRLVGGSVTDFQNRTTQLAPGGGLSIASVTSFGEDYWGEMYIVDQAGEVFKIRPVSGPFKGDLNNDGVINFNDIDAFVLALTNPTEYQNQYGLPATRAGDLNCSGTVDFDDIDPFVERLGV